MWWYATSGFAAWSISVLGVGVELDPLRRGDRLSLVDETGDERAQVGPLADTAVRQAGERPDRVRRRVEDDLPPLRAAGVRDRLGRHAAARARLGEPFDLRGGRRLRLERAERRVAPHVPLNVAGFDDLPGGEGRAPYHPRHVLGERLLVAEPVLHGRHAAAREGVRRCLDRRLRVHRLRRDDAEVTGGKLPSVRGRAEPARRLRPRPRGGARAR